MVRITASGCGVSTLQMAARADGGDRHCSAIALPDPRSRGKLVGLVELQATHRDATRIGVRERHGAVRQSAERCTVYADSISCCLSCRCPYRSFCTESALSTPRALKRLYTSTASMCSRCSCCCPPPTRVSMSSTCECVPYCTSSRTRCLEGRPELRSRGSSSSECDELWRSRLSRRPSLLSVCCS